MAKGRSAAQQARRIIFRVVLFRARQLTVSFFIADLVSLSLSCLLMLCVLVSSVARSLRRGSRCSRRVCASYLLLALDKHRRGELHGGARVESSHNSNITFKRRQHWWTTQMKQWSIILSALLFSVVVFWICNSYQNSWTLVQISHIRAPFPQQLLSLVIVLLAIRTCRSVVICSPSYLRYMVGSTSHTESRRVKHLEGPCGCLIIDVYRKREWAARLIKLLSKKADLHWDCEHHEADGICASTHLDLVSR